MSHCFCLMLRSKRLVSFRISSRVKKWVLPLWCLFCKKEIIIKHIVNHYWSMKSFCSSNEASKLVFRRKIIWTRVCGKKSTGCSLCVYQIESTGTNKQSTKVSYKARAESGCPSIRVRGNTMRQAPQRREHNVFMRTSMKTWNQTESMTLKNNLDRKK